MVHVSRQAVSYELRSTRPAWGGRIGDSIYAFYLRPSPQWESASACPRPLTVANRRLSSELLPSTVRIARVFARPRTAPFLHVIRPHEDAYSFFQITDADAKTHANLCSRSTTGSPPLLRSRLATPVVFALAVHVKDLAKDDTEHFWKRYYRPIPSRGLQPSVQLANLTDDHAWSSDHG